MEKRTPLSKEDSHEQSRAETLGKQLNIVLDNLVATGQLTEHDKHILPLRIRLEDGRCHTLHEVSSIVHKSPEAIRRRQYYILKRCVMDMQLLQILNYYAHAMKLPKGLVSYIYQHNNS